MSKHIYIYKYIDRCDPSSGAYHEGGGLIVITGGYPNDAVPNGTGNQFETGDQSKFGLPEPDFKIAVSGSTPDLVLAFPDSGCC